MLASCTFLVSESAFSREPFFRTLTADGISFADSDTGPVILIFDRFTPELLVAAREITRGGARRVLGIAIRPLADSELWQLLGGGLSDVLVWDPLNAPRAVAARLRRWEAVEQIVDSPAVQRVLIGRSIRWRTLLCQLVETAAFTDASILIVGQTGTGKELLARLIHTLDQRQEKGELVLLDCTTVVPELAGSDFFGHERGAYTGAVAGREGAFAMADRGTLFLDEVGELEPRLQSQLLRVIQERTYKAVGGNTWRSARFRLVSATSRDLRAEADAGRFRPDLYYRIAACVFHTVPLADRKEDIPLLARHFVADLARTDPPPLDDAVVRYLLALEYPGNVRDLRQLITRMMARYPGSGPLGPACVPEDERPRPEATIAPWQDAAFEAAIRRACLLGAQLKDIGRAAEETAVRIALEAEDGKLHRAAARLGVTDRALQLRRSAGRARHERLAS